MTLPYLLLIESLRLGKKASDPYLSSLLWGERTLYEDLHVRQSAQKIFSSAHQTNIIDTYGQIFGTKMKTHFGSFTETPIPTFEMRAMLYP